jgi:hypothetical protein
MPPLTNAVTPVRVLGSDHLPHCQPTGGCTMKNQNVRFTKSGVNDAYVGWIARRSRSKVNRCPSAARSLNWLWVAEMIVSLPASRPIL